MEEGVCFGPDEVRCAQFRLIHMRSHQSRERTFTYSGCRQLVLELGQIEERVGGDPPTL